MKDEIIVNTDGGSRGNPGPSACGIVITRNGEVIHKEGIYLGINTNNFAEYMGVLLSLRWLKENIKDVNDVNIIYNLDSELLVRQVNGIYKVKSPNLIEMFIEIKKLEKNFPHIKFVHVYREKNKTADSLVNNALDENV